MKECHLTKPGMHDSEHSMAGRVRSNAAGSVEREGNKGGRFEGTAEGGGTAVAGAGLSSIAYKIQPPVKGALRKGPNVVGRGQLGAGFGGEWGGLTLQGVGRMGALKGSNNQAAARDQQEMEREGAVHRSADLQKLRGGLMKAAGDGRQPVRRSALGLTQGRGLLPVLPNNSPQEAKEFEVSAEAKR